jgi:hypothetical protein
MALTDGAIRAAKPRERRTLKFSDGRRPFNYTSLRQVPSSGTSPPAGWALKACQADDVVSFRWVMA